MEIFEVLFSMVDCSCTLELVTALLDLFAGFRTAKHYQARREGVPSRTNWGLILLVFVATLVTGSLFFKWYRQMGSRN